jgi:hypothetical protein
MTTIYHQVSEKFNNYFFLLVVISWALGVVFLMFLLDYFNTYTILLFSLVVFAGHVAVFISVQRQKTPNQIRRPVIIDDKAILHYAKHQIRLYIRIGATQCELEHPFSMSSEKHLILKQQRFNLFEITTKPAGAVHEKERLQFHIGKFSVMDFCYVGDQDQLTSFYHVYLHDRLGNISLENTRYTWKLYQDKFIFLRYPSGKVFCVPVEQTYNATTGGYEAVSSVISRLGVFGGDACAQQLTLPYFDRYDRMLLERVIVLYNSCCSACFNPLFLCTVKFL